MTIASKAFLLYMTMGPEIVTLARWHAGKSIKYT